MKTLTEYLKFHTKTQRAYLHITPQVEQIVAKSGVQEGMVLVSAMHITAGIYVNDNESGLIEDIDQWLDKLDFGTWQRIFYAEFDGQREKRVIVKVMGE